MMPRRHDKADGIAIMQLGAVGARIEPVFFGIARDAERAGANISAAVFFMPDGRWKAREIDFATGEHMFEDGTAIDNLVRDDARIGEKGLAVAIAQIPFAQTSGETKGHVPPRAGKHVQKQPESLGTAGNFIK